MHRVPHLRGSLTVERRRHRYESNREYEAVLTSEGVRIAAPRLNLCRDRRDPQFPSQKVPGIGFTESQFESYRRLGLASVQMGEAANWLNYYLPETSQ